MEELRALPASDCVARVAAARQSLRDAGADLVIDSVASLVPELERVMRR